MNGSPKFELSKEEAIKLLKGAGYAIAGAFIVYLSNFLSNTDFGNYTPIATAFASILVYWGNKYFRDTTN